MFEAILCQVTRGSISFRRLMLPGPAVTTPLASALAVVLCSWLRSGVDQLSGLAVQSAFAELREVECGPERRQTAAWSFAGGSAVGAALIGGAWAVTGRRDRSGPVRRRKPPPPSSTSSDTDDEYLRRARASAFALH